MKTIIAAIAIALMFGMAGCGNTYQPTKVPQTGKRNQPAKAIEYKESLKPGSPQIDGIAIMLAIDVSGSMNETVKDAANGLQKKIIVARNCARKIAAQIVEYSARKEKNVVLGICLFHGEARVVLQPTGSFGENINTALNTEIKNPNGTGIGNAIALCKKTLNETRCKKTHIIVITDGQNNAGVHPATVVKSIAAMSPEETSGIFIIGFDVAAAEFKDVKANGALVFSAANETELLAVTNHVLSKEILAEKPE